MTLWRLKNKWCNKCPYKQENVDELQRNYEAVQKELDEIKYRYKVALEHVDELADRLRRYVDS